MKKLAIILSFPLAFTACQNKDINEGEEFRPRALHENFEEFEFSVVNVEGVDYWIMERDNNNPHEGFGFMALRGNRLMNRQDSVLAYLKTMTEMQAKIYARLHNISDEESDALYRDLFDSHLRSTRQSRLTEAGVSAAEETN